MEEAYINTLARWGLAEDDIAQSFMPATKEQMVLVLAISLGLGALFNEDIEAERQWMKARRADFGGLSAFAMFVNIVGDDVSTLHQIFNMVNEERGL